MPRRRRPPHPAQLPLWVDDPASAAEDGLRPAVEVSQPDPPPEREIGRGDGALPEPSAAASELRSALPSVPAAVVRQILLGRNRGHTAGEIADALGVSRSTVRHFVGLPASELRALIAKLEARDRDAARVHALAAEGWEPAAIAQRLGLAHTSVEAMLAEQYGMEERQ